MTKSIRPFLGAATVILGSILATGLVQQDSGASPASHHAARVHALAVHHAHRVHVARVRHAAAVHRATLLRRSHGYGMDWWTTDTAHWDCIRVGESGRNYRDYSGAYGILAGWNVGGLPDVEQDAWALRILHGYGWGAWSTAPGCGL